MKDKRRNISPETKRNNPRNSGGKLVDEIDEIDGLMWLGGMDDFAKAASRAMSRFGQSMREVEVPKTTTISTSALKAETIDIRGASAEWKILDEFADLTERVSKKSSGNGMPMSRRQRKKRQIEAMLEAGKELRLAREQEAMRLKEYEARGWGEF